MYLYILPEDGLCYRNMLEILTVIYLLVYFNNKTLCNKLDIQNNK